ncbi:MAG: response regulator [Deltaproteobacteria bacterium]|nr:MAG: response regulator [Deltaproteobacteria bacterium]
MKILVVDDESIVLDSCQLVLRAEGFEVLLLPSANEALKAMEKNDFAILLVDLKMPGLDGIYLIREARKKQPKIPIIAMSGYPTTETIEEAVRTGAVTFIAKPFTPDELIEKVREILQKEQGSGDRRP